MAQAHRELQPGEHVSWNYGAGQAKGQVVEKLTENKKLGSRIFKASPEDPKYLVKSDTSGKEAIKKPETLHKIDEADTDSAPQSHMEVAGQKHEVGAKDMKECSSKEECKADENEETSKKASNTVKGSVRASAKTAKTKIKGASSEGDAALMDDAGEERDVTYKPKKAKLEAHDHEEAMVTSPTDEEVIVQAEKEAKEVGVKETGEADIVGDVAEDEEVINTLPPNKECIKQVERENKEAFVDTGTEAQKSSGTTGKKKGRSN